MRGLKPDKGVGESNKDINSKCRDVENPHTAKYLLHREAIYLRE